MSLTPGMCLGPYEILSAIGAGGMGAVDRARDSRLKRDVAINVLHSSILVRGPMTLRAKAIRYGYKESDEVRVAFTQ